ncbi:MAG: hypothetical protein HOW73_32985 [Polyangiaceae bacterium]|nr:hypothetical protein [Polyangiaceae bacterium]
MESPPRKLPPKKDVLDAFLGNGSARVFVDPRRPGVSVPKWFLKQPELVLRVGYSLSPPIPDLVVSDEAVSCTLSFNRSPFWCKLPWNAVFAVVSDVDGRGVVWPEDVPVESQLLKPARPKPKLASVGPQEPSASPPATPNADAVAAGEGETAAETAEAESSEAGAAPVRTLQAVPSEAAPEAASADAPEKAPEKAPEAEPAADSEGESQGKKPKRQLPPYLRVVK